MFTRIIKTSIEHRFVVLLLSVALVVAGVLSYQRLVIDAVPDITNVQVQINSPASGYSPFEVEQRITQPIELILAGLPALESTRSISRYGLSQVTAIFRDGTDIYFARSLISQRLQESRDRLPPGVSPQMGPLSTGLGEILMYTLENDPEAGGNLSLEELREVQDWVVKPQLRTVPGVVEINSIGGASKQIIVTPNLEKLRSYEFTLNDVSQAIARNNTNVGAGFIEGSGEQLLIRVPAQAAAYGDLREVVVGIHQGTPVLVRDVADVKVGSELRVGAATDGGKEIVLGNVMMLVGENGRDVSLRVSEKLEEIQPTLPTGVSLKLRYKRSSLVDSTIETVRRNLLEGALLVIAILFVALGNLRAAIITACVIPLSMLMTILGMVRGDLSANLMSLGALDFGLIVDGAVILVENCIKRLGEAQEKLGRNLSKEERLDVVFNASTEVRQATMFGELIIMVVYVPILALSGIEGKMYHPMAITVLLALGASFILSLTFVPAAVATFVTGRIRHGGGLLERLQHGYARLLATVLASRRAVVGSAAAFFVASVALFTQLGSEFVPSLDEGDVALHALRIPGTSLSQSIAMQHELERSIKAVPEVSDIFAKIGTAEVATDPMPPSVADGYVILKPRSEWPNPSRPKAEVVSEIEKIVSPVPGNNYEFTQPIQMRFNELIAGVRSDVAVKVFGDDTEVLLEQAQAIKSILDRVPGAADTKVEQMTGLPTVTIKPDRAKLARLGLNASDVQEVIRMAYAGEEVSAYFEGDRRFPVVVRLGDAERQNLEAIKSLPIAIPAEVSAHKKALEIERTSLHLEAPDRAYVALGDIAEVSVLEGPNQISRENGKRRAVVTANVRDRDIGSFVEEAQAKIASGLALPSQYWLGWGGQYEHLLSAEARLMVIVPLVLVSVFALIYLTFRSFSYSVLVFSGVPFALSGGIMALWLRGIPFSISAAVGFIALSGVSVLNGLVLITFTKNLFDEGRGAVEAVIQGATARLRPVLMTALVASLGFVPMAVSQGTGSEVQRPLATVVIGGIVSATALTLIVVPVLLAALRERELRTGSGKAPFSRVGGVAAVILITVAPALAGCAASPSVSAPQELQNELPIQVERDAPKNVRLDVSMTREADAVVFHVHLNEHRASRTTFGHIHVTVFDAAGQVTWQAEEAPKLARHGSGRAFSYAEFSFRVPRALVEGGKIRLHYDVPGD